MSSSDDSIFRYTIIENTNGYAEEKLSAVGLVLSWVVLTTPELHIFFAIQIYMGIVKCLNIEMYWEPELKQAPFKYMSLVRYQQIKRFYHLSPPGISLDKQHWYRKLEPIASLLRQRFQQYYFPSTNLSYDEMMVSFEGRSMHIVKQPNKPIDHGYKIWGLCDHGYTWAFLFYSGAVGNEVSEFT